MSDADIKRWEDRYARYASGEKTPAFNTDSLLLDHAALFNGDGNAIDIASGVSGNVLWLAEQGYAAKALDGSATSLSILEREAQRRGITIDVDAADLDDWLWPTDQFDVVCVFRYLNRNLFEAMGTSLRPGGLLVYQTFNQNHLIEKPNFNPSYVLADNELNDAFKDLEVIVNDQTGPSTRYIGRKA